MSKNPMIIYRLTWNCNPWLNPTQSRKNKKTKQNKNQNKTKKTWQRYIQILKSPHTLVLVRSRDFFFKSALTWYYFYYFLLRWYMMRKLCHQSQELQKLCHQSQDLQKLCHHSQNLQKLCHQSQELSKLCHQSQELQKVGNALSRHVLYEKSYNKKCRNKITFQLWLPFYLVITESNLELSFQNFFIFIAQAMDMVAPDEGSNKPFGPMESMYLMLQTKWLELTVCHCTLPVKCEASWKHKSGRHSALYITCLYYFIYALLWLLTANMNYFSLDFILFQQRKRRRGIGSMTYVSL